MKTRGMCSQIGSALNRIPGFGAWMWRFVGRRPELLANLRARDPEFDGLCRLAEEMGRLPGGKSVAAAENTGIVTRFRDAIGQLLRVFHLYQLSGWWDAGTTLREMEGGK